MENCFSKMLGFRHLHLRIWLVLSWVIIPSIRLDRSRKISLSSDMCWTSPLSKIKLPIWLSFNKRYTYPFGHFIESGLWLIPPDLSDNSSWLISIARAVVLSWRSNSRRWRISSKVANLSHAASHLSFNNTLIWLINLASEFKLCSTGSRTTSYCLSEIYDKNDFQGFEHHSTYFDDTFRNDCNKIWSSTYLLTSRIDIHSVVTSDGRALASKFLSHSSLAACSVWISAFTSFNVFSKALLQCSISVALKNIVVKKS